MLGTILFFVAFAIALIVMNVIKKRIKEKDGPVIDLADFEYDSKKQVLGKKEHLDEMFNDSTDLNKHGLAGNIFDD